MGTIYGIEDLPQRNETYEVIKDDVVEDADVCIIGSGAAGAALAKELLEGGRSVVLLERGGYYEGLDMNQRDRDMMPLLWKNAGFNFDDNLRIAIAQGSCLGGSTIINDAVCFDPPARVREEWKALGVDFTDDEWSRHTAKVNTILNVSEVSEHDLNRNNLMLKKGAEKLGLRDHRANDRNSVNCMHCGFTHLGCHYQTKQDVLVTYIHEALKDPDSDMRVYCNCYVHKIVHRNGLVEGVEGEFRDAGGGNTYRIRVNAKVVMVSAGAIASSKLLLRNGIAQSTAGRGLCLHPAPLVLGDFDYEIKGNQGIPMAYTVHDFGVLRRTNQTMDDHDFHDGEFLIESIFVPLLEFSMGIPAGPSEHRKLLQRYNNYAMAGILVRDDNNGRVSLTQTGRASVAYELGEKELKTVAKGMEILGKMWFALDARRIITSHRNMMIVEKETDIQKLKDAILTDPKNLLLASAHPQSGNRIGVSPDDSVVDSDCKVHGFGNLFVCDASVFPTSVGVNPQITVMTVASIIASRVLKDWESKYADIPLASSLGNTCSISQPMYCLRKSLSEMFDSTDTLFDAAMLVNSASDKADETNWEFDPDTLEITNNSHWKGIFPRDPDIPNTLALYFGGFWKRFAREGSAITGITHPFEVPVRAKNRATDREIEGFGKAIMLDYTEPVYDQFHDVLKIVDENTILGKAFFGDPVPGREMLTFSMSRKYPLEFMTEEDHDMLYRRMQKPTLETMIGVWDGRLVSDSTWSDPLFRFRFSFDDDGQLKNDYLFARTLAGTAAVSEREDHLRMDDLTQRFHDEIRQVNEDIMIGKYSSEASFLFQWLPEGLSFLHIDQSQPAVQLLYVMRRIGEDTAFREYSD